MRPAEFTWPEHQDGNAFESFVICKLRELTEKVRQAGFQAAPAIGTDAARIFCEEHGVAATDRAFEVLRDLAISIYRGTYSPLSFFGRNVTRENWYKANPSARSC